MSIDQNTWNQLLEFISSYKFYVPIFTLCFTIIFIRSSKRVVEKLIIKEAKSIEIKRKNTMIKLIENVVKYFILLLAIIVVLSVWGINVSGILAGIGVVGVVAGLAIQDALKDIIMGMNIIMDNYFVVGDIVRYNDFTGEVIDFSLKQTKIKNHEGLVLIVANRNISEIKNLSQKNAMLFITIPTPYEVKSDKMEKVLSDICKKISDLEFSTADCENLGIDNFGDSSVDYLIKAYCAASNRFTMKRQILGLVRKEFEKNKVSIPYSQIVVHNEK